MRSDVPIAFCMSGGVDSNALISMAKHQNKIDIHGFTVSLTNSKYNEDEFVKKAVKDLKISHTSVKIQKKNFLEDLRILINSHDCPVSTISYFFHWKK